MYLFKYLKRDETLEDGTIIHGRPDRLESSNQPLATLVPMSRTRTNLDEGAKSSDQAAKFGGALTKQSLEESFFACKDSTTWVQRQQERKASKSTHVNGELDKSST